MSNHSAVAVFELTSDELRKRIEDHVVNVEGNLRKCELYLAEMKFAPENPWGARWTTVEEILATIVRSLKNRIVEDHWYIDHLAVGPFPVTAAQLVGFMGAFAPFDLNIERAILSVYEAPKPGSQPEREHHELMVQVPRTTLPPGAVA